MGSRCRFVSPMVERLSLSEGDWVDVKADLNAGEYYDMLVSLDARQAFAKLLAYLIAWSLVDHAGVPVPYGLDLPENVRRDTLRSVDTPTIRELIATVDRHERAHDDARNTKKKPTASAAISPSVA